MSLPSLLGLVTVSSGVADNDAPQILNVAGAFAAHTLGAAAELTADLSPYFFGQWDRSSMLTDLGR